MYYVIKYKTLHNDTSYWSAITKCWTTNIKFAQRFDTLYDLWMNVPLLDKIFHSSALLKDRYSIAKIEERELPPDPAPKKYEYIIHGEI
jgi:hypothetical protein